MSANGKVLFVKFEKSIGPGMLLPLFEKEGFTVLTMELFKREQVVPVKDVDVLVFLGGEMSVYQTEEFPQLLSAMDAIREGIAQSKAILGVCLGGQLIAQSLGAKVTRNKVKELGYRAITFSEKAATDPVLSFSKGTHHLFEWHGDTFAIPHGSELLASSPTCANQLFRPTPGVYALQFHLEIDSIAFGKWIASQGNIDELAEENLTPAEIIEQHKLYSEKQYAWTSEFVRRFSQLAQK